MRSLKVQTFLFAMCVALALSGCVATTLATNKDNSYTTKLSSVIIWDAGGLSESYSTLTERMKNTAESLRSNLMARNVKATVLTTKQLTLNREDQLKRLSTDLGANHYLQLRVFQAKKRGASIAVEFYNYDVTLVDIKSGKEVWKTTVNANFYSSPESMAKDLVEQLAKDNFF